MSPTPAPERERTKGVRGRKKSLARKTTQQPATTLPSEPPGELSSAAPPPEQGHAPDYELLLAETMFELAGLEALCEALWQVSEFLPPGRTPAERRRCEHLHALLMVTADRVSAVLDDLEAELALPESTPDLTS